MSIINGAVLLKRKSEITFNGAFMIKIQQNDKKAGLGDFYRLPDFLAYFLFFSEDFVGKPSAGKYAYNLVPFKEIRRFIVLARGRESGRFAEYCGKCCWIYAIPVFSSGHQPQKPSLV